MPKLWNETIAAHRENVREAILDAAWRLVGERGLSAVTMSLIAAEAGIGRATLYKYFSDVDAILLAWHERQVGEHLRHLDAISEQHADPDERLRAVLTGYAVMTRHRGNHAGDLTTLLHHGADLDSAQRQLLLMVTDLIADAASAGAVRADIEPGQLASYCLHALGAAGDMPDDAAVLGLVDLVVDGLRPSV